MGIIVEAEGIEPADIIRDCMDLELIHKSICKTVTGGYMVEFWSLTCLMTWLASPLTKGTKGYEKIESIFARPDQNRWIKGIPKGFSKTLLESNLRGHGVEGEVQVIRNKNGYSKGCCHVMCKSTADAVRLDNIPLLSFNGSLICTVDSVNRKDQQQVDITEEPIPQAT